MVHEQFHGYEDVYTVRRPYFYLDIDEFFLQDLVYPTVVIPGEKAAASHHFATPGLEGTWLSALWKGLGEGHNCLQKSGDCLSFPQTTLSPRAVAINNLSSGTGL